MGKMFFCSRQAFLPLVCAICSMLLVSGCSESAQSKRQSSIIGQDKALAQAQEAYKAGDLRTAMRIWRQLSEKGNPAAKFNIGLMYSSGILFQKNDAVAAKLYKEAADEGLAQAQNNLATMYTSGKGVPQDYLSAFNWFRKSADQGYAQAQLYLGIVYFLGLGVSQNYIEAHKWCNLSAAGASDPEVQTAAAECRRKVASNMPADKIAEAQRLASAWKPLKGTNISAYAEMALKVTRYRESIAKGDEEFFGPPTKKNKVFAAPRAPASPEGALLPGEVTFEQWQKVYGQSAPAPKAVPQTPALPEVVSQEEYEASLRPQPQANRPALPEVVSQEEYEASLRPKPQAYGGRTAYRAGGKVNGIEPLVMALMSKAKMAKKTSKITREEYEASLPSGYSREDHEFFGPIYLPPVPPQT